MAASNVNFWTSRGWDGSEDMMKKSQMWCTRLPRGTRATILSSSFAQTVIITLQGVQALYILVGGTGTQSNYSATIAVDSIFFPLAVLGLLRLLAALWLTDDFTYTEQDTMEQPSSYTLSVPASTKPFSAVEMQPFSTTSLLDPTYDPDDLFHSLSSRRAIIVRLLYLLPIIGLFAISTILGFGRGSVYFSSTNFVMNLFYLWFLAATILIFSFYFLRGQTTTTCLPCINSLWYKIHTGTQAILVLMLIVLASVETRRTPCGSHTTFPALWDHSICHGYIVDSNATHGYFAMATWLPIGDNKTATVDEREMRALYFDGWCQGTPGDIVDLGKLNETVTSRLDGVEP